MDPHFENLGNKIKIILNFNSVNCNLNKIIYEMTLTEKERCGGVKPGPMRWAQEQRFINNMPEEKKS